jgi:hypothetical protein
MNKFIKMAMVSTLALSITGAALAGGPKTPRTHKAPKGHHNPHRPGKASGEVPGGHHQSHVKINKG